MIPQRGHDHDGHQIAPFQRGGRQTGAAQCSQRVLAMPARRCTELIEHPPLLTPRPRSVAFRHRRPPRFNRIGSTRDDSATVRAKFLSTHRRLLWMDVGCRSRVLRSLQPMSTNLLVSLLTAQVLAMSLFFTEAYPEAIIPLLQIALGAVVASAILLFCIDMTRIAHEWLRARKSRQYSRVRLR
jgi:hypothetical protein